MYVGHMNTTTATKSLPYTDVIAEDAPLGVQLWPSRPGCEDAFILRSVAVIRDEMDEANGRAGHVVWTYRNGNVRTFLLGEKIAAKIVP